MLLLLACAPLAANAAPVPKEDDTANLLRAYGTWSDPDKDCKYVLKGGELRVSLPKDEHLLAPEREGRKNNAPRLLSEVKGDFTAVVRVTFPVPERVPKGFWPYCSGGLIAWESNERYFVVRRSGGDVNGNQEAIWTTQTTGLAIKIRVQGLGKPAESAFVRLKREGKKAIVGWSRDGKAWKDDEPVDVEWGGR